MTTTAVANKSNGVYLIPPPPPPSASVLPVADGKPPSQVNIGGITLGPAGASLQIFQAPGMVVPLGMVVRVRGNPGNTAVAIVATLRENAAAGDGDPVNANTEIIFPVSNLSQVYVRLGATGDGVTISVRSS